MSKILNLTVREATVSNEGTLYEMSPISDELLYDAVASENQKYPSLQRCKDQMHIPSVKQK
jgi:hypothetical protein